MSQRIQVVLLIIACLVVIGLIKGFVNREPDPSDRVQAAMERLDMIQQRLTAYAEENAQFPTQDDWANVLGLSPEQMADPFSTPEDSEPFDMWSNGRWYVLQSPGPDGGGDRTVEYFHMDLIRHRTDAELAALLGEGEIYSDIRFRNAIYDPTNGINSWGDIVRWGSLEELETGSQD